MCVPLLLDLFACITTITIQDRQAWYSKEWWALPTHPRQINHKIHQNHMGCTVISKRMTFENILKGQLITCQSDRPKRFEYECRKCTNSRFKKWKWKNTLTICMPMLLCSSDDSCSLFKYNGATVAAALDAWSAEVRARLGDGAVASSSDESSSKTVYKLFKKLIAGAKGLKLQHNHRLAYYTIDWMKWNITFLLPCQLATTKNLTWTV